MYVLLLPPPLPRRTHRCLYIDLISRQALSPPLALMYPILMDMASWIAERSNRYDANTECLLGTEILYQNGFIFEHYTIKFTNDEFYVHGPEISLKTVRSC